MQREISLRRPQKAAANIRRAIASDATPLTRLMHRSPAYRGRYAAILSGYEITSSQIDRDEIYVACSAEGEHLGFYSLTLQPEPELDLLFVADVCQGSGLGAALFDHFVDQARRLRIASVLIVSHPPAKDFYSRMGAVQIGTQLPSGRVSWSRPVFRFDIWPERSEVNPAELVRRHNGDSYDNSRLARFRVGTKSMTTS